MAATSRNAGTGGSMTDDLPRTLRREREARERAAQSQSSFQGLSATSGPSHTFVPEPPGHDGVVVTGSTVTDIRIPFVRLMMFGFKLVFAAVPALILLGALLWLAGHLLMTFFPWLVKLQILIRVP